MIEDHFLITPLLLNLGWDERTHSAWKNIHYSRETAFQQLWPVKPFLRTPLPVNYLNHNLSRGIQYQTDSASSVYASHVLVHLAHFDTPKSLKEIFGCLSQEGIIRLVVPDLEFVACNYLSSIEVVRSNNDSTPKYKLRHD